MDVRAVNVVEASECFCLQPWLHPEQSCLSCCHVHVTKARRSVDISHPASGLGQGEVLPVLSNTAQPFQGCLYLSKEALFKIKQK